MRFAYTGYTLYLDALHPRPGKGGYAKIRASNE